MVEGAAEPVGAPVPILTLSDDERREQGRPVLPTRSTTYRIALSPTLDLAVPVPVDWRSLPLKAVGDDRLFVDPTGTAELEVETERWDGDALGWVTAADEESRASTSEYVVVALDQIRDRPDGLRGTDLAMRTFLFREDGVARHAQDLAVTLPEGGTQVMYLRLSSRAEDFPLLQRVWQDAFAGMRLVSTGG